VAIGMAFHVAVSVSISLELRSSRAQVLESLDLEVENIARPGWFDEDIVLDAQVFKGWPRP